MILLAVPRDGREDESEQHQHHDVDTRHDELLVVEVVWMAAEQHKASVPKQWVSVSDLSSLISV